MSCLIIGNNILSLIDLTIQNLVEVPDPYKHLNSSTSESYIRQDKTLKNRPIQPSPHISDIDHMLTRTSNISKNNITCAQQGLKFQKFFSPVEGSIDNKKSHRSLSTIVIENMMIIS